MGRKGSYASLAVALALVGPPLTAPQRRETVRGAYARSMDRFEIFWRGIDNERVNVGAWGRINSTRDQVRQAEEPAIGSPPFSFWQRW
jgi:hypothetical protein